MSLVDPTALGANVALDAQGNITAGSGLKLAVFNAVSITGAPVIPTLGQTTAPFSALRPATQSDIDNMKKAAAQAKQLVADIINGAALPIMQYIGANSVVVVTIPSTAAGDGLQTSAAAGSPSTHPATPKTITGSIS